MISSEIESIEEIKHRLLCTKFELITARMEASAEIKKYEETIKRLYKLLKRVCQERDEARDQLQLLTRNFQPSSTPAETSSTIIPQVDHPKLPPVVLKHKTKPSSVKSTTVSDVSSNSKAFSNSSCDLSLASPQPNEKHSSMDHLSNTRIAESCNLALPKQPNRQNKPSGASRDDSASLVIEKLVCGKPLPQNGRLLQSVTEAGPLLHTLLVAPPLPQWKNPPPLSSPALSLCTQENNYLFTSTDDDDKASANPDGFIPTSLTLAFPGNSSAPSQKSYASSFGLAVKNEPMSYVGMDSNGLHNHTIVGKKRKFL